MQTYTLGHEVERNGKKWLVVRVVNSISLIETSPISVSKITETYVQLRAASGEFEFVGLNEFEEEFTTNTTIKALPIMPWRRKNAIQTAGSPIVGGTDHNNVNS
jgi:hypothetical protein